MFQANPKQWDLAAKLPDMPPGHVEDWTVTRYRTEMRPGDGVLLWASGPEGGIHLVGRLTSEPQQSPTPDFRPADADPNEYRVDFRVVRHVVPHITRTLAKNTPELADLAVLKLANATNFRVTPRQWRAVHALIPLGDGPETTGWTSLLHWAERFAQTVDLDADRRGPLATAELLAMTRTALADGDWRTTLSTALGTSELDGQVTDELRTWLAADAPSVRRALDALWADGDVEAGITTFAQLAPSTMSASSSCAVLASFLLGARDVTRYPLHQLRMLEKAYALVEWPHERSLDPAVLYTQGLEFLDEFRDRLQSTAARELRDRLDADVLLRRVLSGKALQTWSQQDKDAYARFVGGSGMDDLADLVALFRRERGYPTEIDVQRGVERAELAVALTTEALTDLNVPVLHRLAGPAYGSPGPQPGFNALLSDDVGRAQVARTLLHLLHGDGPLVDRLADCLQGGYKLLRVGEAVLVKALAVAQPQAWFPGYVSRGEAGKLAVLDLLGRPDSRAGSQAEVAVRTNETIRRLLEPHFADDSWAMQAFSWWLLHREHVPESSLATLADELYLTEEFLAESVELLEDKGQVVFYGPPGTGKTFVARRLAGHLARGGGLVEKVQFHPSYAYEDFIEGYRPRLSDGGQVTYEVVDGPLKKIAAQANERPDVTHVLLIDELNRGNVAKILGELLFLLEYRDEEIRLQYSETPFALPVNLKIIATMNTADRSIALVDTALRRRFHFVPFFPDTPPIDGVLRRWLGDHAPELVWVADVVDRANAELADRNLAIGPSHFLRPGLTEQVVERAWRYSVLPFLEEHFYGDPTALERFALDRLRSGG
nr:AAA family ATPase [Kineococcus siccus]